MPRITKRNAGVCINFVQYFPHKFWVSSWQKNESYPEGFRYKIVSALDDYMPVIEFLVVLESVNGFKWDVHRFVTSLKRSQENVEMWLDILEKQHGVVFQEHDFSSFKSAEEFEQASHSVGWTEWSKKEQ